MEPCDNTPVLDNLPPAGGVCREERSKYQEDVSNLYKQLDDKVAWHLADGGGNAAPQIHVRKCFSRRMTRSTSTVSWPRSSRSR